MRSRHRGWLAAVPTLLFAGAAAAASSNDLSKEVENLALEEQLLNTVAAALPESKVVDAAYLDSVFDPNIHLREDAQIGLSFLDEGAGFRNSFGYFTYTSGAFSGLTNGDIDRDRSGYVSLNELQRVKGITSVGMIFNNASEAGGGGLLKPGDSVILGGGWFGTDDSGALTMNDGTVFSAGTNVGFFLGADAWTGKTVSTDATYYYSVDFLNPEAGAKATVDNAGELARHVAMGFADASHSEIIVGFEDLDRRKGSDDDFNDIVFRVWSDPVKAIADNNIDEFHTYAAPAPLIGQGAPGLVALMGSLLAWRRRALGQAIGQLVRRIVRI